MRKTIKILTLFLIFLLASCSSDNLNTDGSDSPDANRYIGFIKISVADNANTRTNEEDDSDPGSDGSKFEEGTERENDVADAKLLVFSTPKSNEELDTQSENNAQYAGEITLEVISSDPNSSVDISRSLQMIGQIDDYRIYDTENFDYYAVVVINDPGFSTIRPGESFKNWKTTTVDKMWKTVGGLLYLTMTNAPKWRQGKEPVTLQKLDLTKMSKSKDQLESAGSFYVQRGAASVNSYIGIHKNNMYQALIDVSAPGHQGDFVAFMQTWNVNNVNTSSYPVQIVEGLSADFPEIWNTPRFYENGNSFWPRVHWGIDPNYYGSDASMGLHVIDEAEYEGDVMHTTAIGTTGYVLENTMAVDEMLRKNTTHVVYKTLYFPGSAIAGWTPEMTAEIHRRIQDSDDDYVFDYDDPENRVTFCRNTENSKIWVNNSSKGWDFKTRLEEAFTNATSENVSINSGLFSQFTRGYYSLDDFYRILIPQKVIDAEAQQIISSQLGVSDFNKKCLAYCPDGIVYYTAPLSHFTEADGAGWSNGDPTYGGDNAHYLGRYGLVRNNNYRINVRTIKNAGEPIIPVPGDDPDDLTVYYSIEIEVKVKPWSMRQTSFDF